MDIELFLSGGLSAFSASRLMINGELVPAREVSITLGPGGGEFLMIKVDLRRVRVTGVKEAGLSKPITNCPGCGLDLNNPESYTASPT